MIMSLSAEKSAHSSKLKAPMLSMNFLKNGGQSLYNDSFIAYALASPNLRNLAEFLLKAKFYQGRRPL